MGRAFISYISELQTNGGTTAVETHKRIMAALTTYELSLSKELVEKIEAGKSKYPSFSIEEAMSGGNHGDIQAAEARDSHNAAKDEDIAIIKATLEAKTEV